MPPGIALLLVSVCVLFALAVDAWRTRGVSPAVWIPTIWVSILASRPLGAWFDVNAGVLGASVEEGSPLDRWFLLLLMFLAAAILVRRKVRWAEWIRQNPWLWIFILYCGISIVWSDFPAVALRRWIRAIGGVMIIMVVLSEADPVAAIAAVVRRSAFVLVPFSVLLIKYYRQWGVMYDAWTGQEVLSGVTTDKNALGRLCLIAGLFVVWDFIASRRREHPPTALMTAMLITLFGTTMWLLKLSGSATSLVTFIVGSSIVIALGLPPIRSKVRFLGTMAAACIAMALVAALSFSLLENVTTSLGRDVTLTDRTFIWADLVAMGTNPLVGVGYDSFWLGQRLERFLREYRVSTAHNGYLEIYLELGMVGLALFGCFLVSTFFKAKDLLSSSFDYGRLRLAMLVVFMLYNLTESGYKVTTSIFFVLLLVGMNVPQLLPEAVRRPAVAKNRLPQDRPQGPRPARPANKWLPTRVPRHVGHTRSRGEDAVDDSRRLSWGTPSTRSTYRRDS